MNRRLATLTALSAILAAGHAAIAAPAPQNDVPSPVEAGGNKFPIPEGDSESPQATAALPATGSLAIQAVQGTPDGEHIGSAEVTVQLFHRGMLLDTIQTQLDGHGVVVLDDLPIESAFQPVVQVAYAGVTYSVVGELMSSEHPQQKLEVRCYEVTEKAPPWKVKMRHVMVSSDSHGIRVNEVMVLESSGARTWLGGEPRPDGKRVTTSFILPEGASDVVLGKGFHDWCCSTIEDDRLVNHLPLMPGTSEMRFSYHVHATDGAAAIDVTAPTQVDQLLVVLPADLTVEAQGLETGPEQTMGDSTVQVFFASNLAAGQRASLGLAGLTASSADSMSESQADAAKMVALFGGGLLLLVAGFIFLRRPKTPAPA